MNPFCFHSYFGAKKKSFFSTNVNIHFYTFWFRFEDAKSRKEKKQVEATTETDQNIEQIEMTFTHNLEFSFFFSKRIFTDRMQNKQ